MANEEQIVFWKKGFNDFCVFICIYFLVISWQNSIILILFCSAALMLIINKKNFHWNFDLLLNIDMKFRSLAESDIKSFNSLSENGLCLRKTLKLADV